MDAISMLWAFGTFVFCTLNLYGYSKGWHDYAIWTLVIYTISVFLFITLWLPAVIHLIIYWWLAMIPIYN